MPKRRGVQRDSGAVERERVAHVPCEPVEVDARRRFEGAAGGHRAQTFAALTPIATDRVEPLMLRASSEQRKSTASEMSSGSA